MSNKKTTKKLDNPKINIKFKLSALWITLMSFYIYADFFSLYQPGEIKHILDGFLGPFPITQGALISASILMMIPAAMIFLSLTLKPKIDRWANIILGILYTLVNIGNVMGETWIYYISYNIIEIGITLLIVWYAWTWPESKNNY